MPIYEFQCDDCGTDFEELYRSINECRGPHCSKCGSKNVHKKFSTFATGGSSGDGGDGGGCGTCSRSSCAGCHG
ncbi:MAG: zinc ribbon domain-containing protein [Anaerolineaceae bacterium]|nr:zinc ribbon domain-containing protein [Anaerolineaceae bacterium]